MDKIVQGNNTIRRLICNEQRRETQLKLIHRAYVPFFRSSVPKPGEKPLSKCSKYQMEKPTLSHCLWDCPPIQSFWKDILLYIKKVMKTQAPLNSHLCLLSIPPEKVTNSMVSEQQMTPWIHICLLTARRTIMHYWVDPNPQSIAHVLANLQYVFTLERREAEE